FELPELLNFNNGTTVSSVSQWEERRLEIYEAFDTEVYGRFPEKIPEVHWKVIAEKDSVIGQYPVVVQKLLGVVDNTSYPNIKVCIEMTLTLPTDYKKVPVILKFDWQFPAGFNPARQQKIPWQEQLLAAGLGYASLIPTSYQADNGAGLSAGIIGLVNKGEPRKLEDWGTLGIIGLVNKGEPRKLEDWGTLKAWAWGASRALDYFKSHPRVNEKKVAIEGLS